MTTDGSKPEQQLEPAPSLKRAAAEGAAGAEQQADAKALRRDKPPSFKVMGHLVMAMKRFSNSINPTYTYGKKTVSTTSSGSRRATANEGEHNQPVTSRPKSPDEHDKYAFEDHGHRFDFLLKPLPPTEEEEAKP